MVILIFGDSITWGAGLPFRTAWANLLRNFLERKREEFKKYCPVELYDLGIDKDTTDDLLKRFYAESKARRPNIIIFAIGVNDSSYGETKNSPLVPIKNFEKNLLKLIQKSREFTDKIIFIGLAKGNDHMTVPLPRSTTGKCYNKENVKIYNKIIRKVCAIKKVSFVNIINELNDKDFYDGLHPNSQGHQKIFEIVKDFLIENKII